MMFFVFLAIVCASLFTSSLAIDESCATSAYNWLPVTAAQVIRRGFALAFPGTENFCASEVEDIDPNLLEKVALYAFGFEMNSYTEEEPAYPIEGVMVTEHAKFVFPIIVGFGDLRVKTLAVFESGCSSVFLSYDTMQAIGLTSNLRTTNVKVNGNLVSAKKAHDAAQHVNIIGQSFLSGNSVFVHDDPETRSVQLKRECSWH